MILLAASGGLVSLVACVAIGWFATRPAKEDSPPVAPKPRKPSGDGQHLTAADLLDRYQGSPAAAAGQYNGATVTVTGTLFYPPTQYPDGEVVVRLAGPRPDGPSVWCRMAPART